MSSIWVRRLLMIYFLSILKYLFFPLHKEEIKGLIHSESFCIMNLGETIVSPSRYNWSSMAFFMWWQDEKSLENFLSKPKNKFFSKCGWHVRMRKYRRWGGIKEICKAQIDPKVHEPAGPIVAVTLARLKLSQTLRFIKWGKPVEGQIKKHEGNTIAYAAMMLMPP